KTIQRPRSNFTKSELSSSLKGPFAPFASFRRMLAAGSKWLIYWLSIQDAIVRRLRKLRVIPPLRKSLCSKLSPRRVNFALSSRMIFFPGHLLERPFHFLMRFRGLDEPSGPPPPGCALRRYGMSPGLA